MASCTYRRIKEYKDEKILVMCDRDFSFCIRKILHLHAEYRKIKILSNYEGDAENLEQKPGPENQNRPPDRFGMEGKNDYDAFLSSNFFVVRFDGDGKHE